MQTAHDEARAGKAQSVTYLLDHLVDALGGEPSCTLRRAVILIDIDQNPDTTQAEIMERMDVHKSALNRDIEWLYDYGCITRKPSHKDARIIQLRTCGYSKKNIDLALAYFDRHHENLKNFLEEFITYFGPKKPTLRDAKIVSLLGSKGKASRQEIFDGLYNGPTTTDNRAVNNLINFGLVQKEDASSR